jgi:hypothetical protein
MPFYQATVENMINKMLQMRHLAGLWLEKIGFGLPNRGNKLG